MIRQRMKLIMGQASLLTSSLFGFAAAGFFDVGACYFDDFDLDTASPIVLHPHRRHFTFIATREFRYRLDDSRTC